jgi:ribonuclease T1
MARLSQRTLRLVGAALVAALALGAWWLQSTGSPEPSGGAGAGAGVRIDAESGLPVVDVADLPPEAAETLALIDAGGPFPHPGKDGSTFHNYEGVLPEQSDGHYREYTVPTPGEDDRGARRIVTGGDPPDAYYWTDDHYETFSVIAR